MNESVHELAPPPPEPQRCALCSAPLPVQGDRCASCGLWMGGHGQALARPTLWRVVAVFATLYMASLLVIALAR